MRFKNVFLVIIAFLGVYSLSFAREIEQRPIVRLIYFLPSDRKPQPDIDEKMDALIKDVQMFYANQMEAHGFQRKTFMFETDAHGKAVVNRVLGQFANEYYDNLAEAWSDVWREVDEQFDTSKNIYLTAIDVENRGPCGLGTDRRALLPASGDCFTWRIAAHELAHAFGLWHAYYLTDAQPDPLYTDDPMLNAFCTAEWLDVHRVFNPYQPDFNNKPTIIETLPPSIFAPPNIIRLRFEVTDPDGIQQVQFFTEGDQIGAGLKWVGCKSLNGTSSGTVEFVTPYLTPKSKFVYLQVIDIHGDSTGTLSMPIDVTHLISETVVSIPDANLAAAVQEEIGNSITTRTLLNLTRLKVHNRQITDLTGLEHAHNLEYLELGDKLAGGSNNNSISNFSPIAGLKQLHTLMLNGVISDISDISELAALPQLVWLELEKNAIADITPLATFTQVEYLWLADNAISNISALSSLTRLTDLHLSRNAISDVLVLARLKHLRLLSLDNNPIADIAPLAELTQLVILNLSNTAISDVTPLAGLEYATNLRTLSLYNNKISDISPLRRLIGLRHLDVEQNSVRDITPLVELVNLETLRLLNNQIQDISPLAKLENLKFLTLHGNPITDRTPLQTLLQQNPRLYVDISLDPPPDTNVSEIEGGDSITGPWLWMIVPTPPGQGGAASINVDSLAAASDGIVTEADIAKSGANEGDAIGHLTWTLAEIRKTGPFFTPSDNITDVVHRIGWADGDVNHHSSYALITLESATDQANVIMRVGGDDAIKVWLNGEVVHNNPVNTESSGFQDNFPVNLIQGDNLLLVKVSEAIGHWRMFVDIDAEVTAIYKPISPTEQVTPDSDVNQDGQINILDLVLVAQQLGEATSSNPRADVNGDGAVNILDLVLVAGAFGEGAAPAAPAVN